ncbi:DEAD/DEAH box helicase [Myxococcota bacterium]|nr:DEAD/DEAH box helicase [Myxococcota bacterium]
MTTHPDPTALSFDPPTPPSAESGGEVYYRDLLLDPFQAEAIRHIKNGQSVLVSAPTGTGKTIIADYIVEQALAAGTDVIYTAPIKALSNQKYRDYTRLFGKERVGLLTGDLVINRDANLRIMTTEILRNMLLMDEQLPNLSHVIIDEIHFLDDAERGTVWEEVLIYLPSRVKVLGLSATLRNLRQFAHWLSFVRDEDVRVVQETHRHVPLRMFITNKDIQGMLPRADYEKAFARWSRDVAPALKKAEEQAAAARRAGGRGRGGRGGRGAGWGGGDETRHTDIVRKLESGEYLPCLYFAFSRKMCEQFAHDLAKRKEASYLGPAEQDVVRERIARFDEDFPKVLTSDQEDMYLKGIAFHHAGLHVGLKALVEELYEQRLVHVLYCTSTFALGINMPAKTVVFHALKKFNGHTVAPLTVRQYMQKAGRAGRRGLDAVGFVVVREDFADWSEDRAAVQLYEEGEYEPVESSFNLAFNSVVNLLHRHPLEKIRLIIDKSFLSFHHMEEGQRDLRRAEKLEEKLREEGWDPDSHASQKPFRGRLKKVRHLVNRSEKAQSKVYDSFMEKVDALKKMGYLGADLEFNAGARVLMHVQIEEIFVTEVVLSGLLDGIEDDLLFGALCCLCNEFSPTVRIADRVRGEAAKLVRGLRSIRFGDSVRLAERVSGLRPTFGAEMMPFGIGWYNGESLMALMLMVESRTDVSGDLVSAFRRAKDLCSQLRKVYEHNDPFMAERLTAIMRKVSRDEVEVID